MTILNTLETFFTHEARVQPGDKLLVAFSGGPDSAALLWGTSRIAPQLELEVSAAHLDHGLDEDSHRRAGAAARMCQSLEIPLWSERREVAALRRSGESLEAASRRVRYDFLEDVRTGIGAAFTLTAHHADDQIETVLLRLLFGSGLSGLSGISAQHDRILRPLLGASRKELHEVARASGFCPVVDPTNLDLAVPRNRIRHRLIPHLEKADPHLGDSLRRLSMAAARFQDRMDGFLIRQVDLQTLQGESSVLTARLAALPGAVLPFALSLMHRSTGLPYPPPKRARKDLSRQLASTGKIGCDCGAGWRWESEDDRLWLRRRRPTPPPFAYTLKVPGDCVILEAGLRFRIEPGRTACWMFASSPRRTGLSLPVVTGDEVTIRNRRPGDRLRPLGCAYTRRLKDVLIDRRVPRRERDCLPLLFVGSRLAWVPGVTVNEAFKVGECESVWVAQIEPL